VNDEEGGPRHTLGPLLPRIVGHQLHADQRFSRPRRRLEEPRAWPLRRTQLVEARQLLDGHYPRHRFVRGASELLTRGSILSPCTHLPQRTHRITPVAHELWKRSFALDSCAVPLPPVFGLELLVGSVDKCRRVMCTRACPRCRLCC